MGEEGQDRVPRRLLQNDGEELLRVRVFLVSSRVLGFQRTPPHMAPLGGEGDP